LAESCKCYCTSDNCVQYSTKSPSVTISYVGNNTVNTWNPAGAWPFPDASVSNQGDSICNGGDCFWRLTGSGDKLTVNISSNGIYSGDTVKVEWTFKRDKWPEAPNPPIPAAKVTLNGSGIWSGQIPSSEQLYGDSGAASKWNYNGSNQIVFKGTTSGSYAWNIYDVTVKVYDAKVCE